jgi:glycosyltransferase involved in cell wall biosynthesis
VVCKANFEISEVEFEKKRSYIYDQVKCLRDAGLIVNVFFLKGRGVYSYLRGALELRKYLENNQFDVVHGHYGFTGFVVGLVSKNPIVVTYHGTDIYEKIGGVISFFSIRWAEWNIFVSKRLYERALFKPRRNFSIFPCGVDLDVFFPVEKKIACEKLGLDPQAKRILFSSSFNNPVKNYPLALEAIELSGVRPIEFLELKNKTREEVALLLNASDLVMITSHFEGSSQIAKEA